MHMALAKQLYIRVSAHQLIMHTRLARITEYVDGHSLHTLYITFPCLASYAG